jgi:hypothetical protein
VYSKSRHGRNWLGVDINSGLLAPQQHVTCICNFVPISSTLNFWDIVISYHKSGISCVLKRNTVFDKSDFYKILSLHQSSVIFGLLARDVWN